jgi:hypothetical protein
MGSASKQSGGRPAVRTVVGIGVQRVELLIVPNGRYESSLRTREQTLGTTVVSSSVCWSLGLSGGQGGCGRVSGEWGIGWDVEKGMTRFALSLRRNDGSLQLMALLECVAGGDAFFGFLWLDM